MARVSVASQKIVGAGITPTYTTPTVDGDVIDSGNVILVVNNASAVSVNVTVQTPLTVDGLAVEDRVVAVPAAETRAIGPFPILTFGQPAGTVDGARVYVNYSAQTSVTRGVFTL